MPHQPQVGDKDFDSKRATAHYGDLDLRTDPTYSYDPTREHPTARCYFCREDRKEEVPLYSFGGGRFFRCPREQCFQRQKLYQVAFGTEGQSDFRCICLPLPVQVVMMEAVLQQKYTRILFAGSVGSSKSYALRWLAHFLCLKKPGFKILLLRRTTKQLQDSHLKPMLEEREILGLGWKDLTKTLSYPNRSTLRFGHCETRGDEYNYQGDSYDLILFDEQTQFFEDMLVYIASRARTDRKAKYGDDWSPVVAGAANPDGVSKDYAISHYILKNPEPKEYPGYNASRYTVIYSLLTDNPYLNADYLESLKDLPRALQDALIHGDWFGYSEGVFFDELLKKDAEPDANGLVRQAHFTELDFGPEYDRFISMDFGYSDWCLVHWWVCLSDGKYYIEDEYKCRLQTVPEIAAEVKRRNRERRLRHRYVITGHDVAYVRGQTGMSDQEKFAREKLPVRIHKGPRPQGWRRLRELLRHDPAGVPLLRIHPKRCPELFTTLFKLRTDPDDPEDIMGSKDDHAAESLRYGAMSRPQPTNRTAARHVVPGTGGELIDRILKAFAERQANAA